ncbi:MAG: transcriptional regulator, LysR-family [Ramlibacter sp.]|jgi:DNA-binding transcriptional LysR family regulator|nr:transcriptional regulator, LysR-family [Ramlibacter sp.]
MHFGWTDLQIFLHVCEAGSMTGAAERCHLTLAAVSARIRGLEESSGVVLLTRAARGVAPTAAGAVLALHARLVLEQVQRMERDLVHARELPQQPIVILANSAALARPWASALVEFDPAPILVRESPSEVTVQSLRSGAADVGIVSDAVDVRGLASRDLGPDPLVLVVAQAHAWAQRASVRFHEVVQLPWIAWGEQSALSTHLLLRAAACGAALVPRFTHPGAGAVLQLVAGGLGVTVLPEAVVHQHRSVEAVACVRLEEPWALRRLLVCHSGNGDPGRTKIAERIAGRWG